MIQKKTGRYEKFRIRCRTGVMGKWSISKHKFQTFVIEIYDDCNFLCIKKTNFKIENYFLMVLIHMSNKTKQFKK